MEEKIAIPLSEYETLKRDSRWLQYLENAGVDNWEGWDFACDEAREDGFFEEFE